jgi:signal transduction histidine kinase
VDWRARDRGLWSTLGALTVLLVALAGLQYKWTSEIGRAEAERRQTQLERSTWRFANAFDREIGQVLAAFFRMEPPLPADAWRSVLQERLVAWRTTEHADIVSQMLIATRTPSGDVRLEECSPGDAAFQPAEWTPDLEPVRQRLQATRGGRDGFFVRPGLLADPPLALSFPLMDTRDEGRPGPRWGPFRLAGVVLLRLDLDYLSQHLLPQLAEAHFGPLAESDFVVAVVRRGDRSVVYSSDPSAGMGVPQPGDVQRNLSGRGGRPGGDRPGVGPRPGVGERPPDEARDRETGRPPVEESPWVLVARHRGGSLEESVARVRRRNLGVGFGVLALLGATAVLLATGAQRARRLARQQMEFVAGVTHELNTPLAAIRSAGQNLADGIVTDPAQVRRYGGLIEKEGGRLTALVAQVLDFAGIESGSRAYATEPVSVATLVDEVLRDHRLALEQAGMTVEKDLSPDLPQVRGDPPALRRALANLVANAVKFASSGQWLAVRAASRPEAGLVVVRVEDRGPGIPRDERERVFEPFFRGPAAERNATPGSGLGLSLVRHVVRAHGGRVHVEGREGGGAAVVLELPVEAGGEKKP